ncbi:MAG: TlpA family protein disulfide reductase [Parabacteroides sp.]|nr:TlpA family protein disulfide reductase [Parabacteroides sp.]
MKHFVTAGIVLLLVLVQTAGAREKTVNRPPFTARSSATIEIDKIVLSDTATVFYIDAFYMPRNWIRIDKDTYLKAGDTRIPIRSGDGIELSKEFWMPDSGEASFRLVFPPLPKDTKTIDFIESDCEDCFKIWDIRLDGRPAPVAIDKSWTQPSVESEAEKTPRIEKGTAVLSGKLLGYQPSMQLNGTIQYQNILTNEDKSVKCAIGDDGSFRVEIPAVAPVKLFFTSPFFTGHIVVAPDRETQLLIDLRETARAASRLKENEKPYGPKAYVKGAYAALNTDLINHPFQVSFYPATREEWERQLDTITGMNLQQYKDYWHGRYRKITDHIDRAAGYNDSYRQICRLSAGIAYLMKLTEAKYELGDAYKRANNIDRRLPPLGFELGKMPAGYYDFIRELDLDHPLMLLCEGYSDLPQILAHTSATVEIENPYGLFEYLIGSGKLEAEEVALLKEYIANSQAGKKPEKLEGMMAIRRRYDELFQEYAEKTAEKQTLTTLLPTHRGLFSELCDVQQIARTLNDLEPLNETALARLDTFAPEYKTVLLEMNDEVIKKIEENKKKTGYILNETPGVPNEELADAIFSKYKGKVIFVDFWATCCAPCRKAMQLAEPVKTALAGKNIVYLYLTGESSPLGAWKNMIPDIHGEHYRLTQAQWNFICDRFQVETIPSYMIIDKNGKQVYFHVGFMGANSMKERLLEETEKL